MKYEEAVKKAEELVSQMSLEEKAGQMLYTAPAIERLGIASYNWWNEALHGVARAGMATVFPQSIGMGASFDPDLARQAGEAVREEGRMKHDLALLQGDHEIYNGLTFWSPNINIVRDPRWGRAQETYGEDPYLTSQMGSGFVRGIQTDHPEDGLPASACAKHMAVHNGPEPLRHGFDARVSQQDLWETYLPAFHELVTKAKVSGVMGAYNRVNGTPCCCNSYFLKDILRTQWGFKGYTVSDCGAIQDISDHHHYTDTKVEAAALSVRNGCELNCGSMYAYLLEAVQKGLLEEKDLTAAVTDLMTIRLMLEADKPQGTTQEIMDRWTSDLPRLHELNKKAAEETMVLLQNNGILPLKDPKKIAVIGPNAMSVEALVGNYNGTPDRCVTVLDGIAHAFPHAQIVYSQGCHLYNDRIEGCAGADDRLTEAVSFAQWADVTILVLGLDHTMEGEEGDAFNGAKGGDRANLLLPQSQQHLLQAVVQAAKKTVVVTMAGGPVDLQQAHDQIDALLHVWYPGAMGGEAVGEILSGKAQPSGRLPETFYHDEDVSWDFTDYSMEGKTYRFFRGKPRFPFGFGLNYHDPVFSRAKKSGSIVSVTVSNPSGEDILVPVQLYAKMKDKAIRTPIFQLVGVKKVSVPAGGNTEVSLELDPYWVRAVNTEGQRVQPSEKTVYYIGDHQPDEVSTCLTGREDLIVED